MEIADREGLLDVAGAELFYRTRGKGPILLTLQGGAGDAEGSDGLATALADRYTVVSCDRRGLARSPIHDPSEPINITTHGDDASGLLAALTSEPAYVFGSSLGALIGLDLAATHPEQVRLLVAHEAALADLLDESERSELKQRQRDVDETFKSEGLFPATHKLLAIAGGFGDDPEPEVEVEGPSGERMARHVANMQFFLTHDAPAAHRYALNLTALRSTREAIVPAAGLVSRDSLPYRCAQSLARLLDRDLHEFPGGHAGYISRPKAFGEELHRALTART